MFFPQILYFKNNRHMFAAGSHFKEVYFLNFLVSLMKVWGKDRTFCAIYLKQFVKSFVMKVNYSNQKKSRAWILISVFVKVK